jgi:C4-dicarboxylate-specific signal transduction histidine kinase
LVPYAVRLFYEGTVIPYAMVLMVILFFFSILHLTRNMNKVTLDSIALRFEKDQLLSEIQLAHAKAAQGAKMAALGEMAGGIAHEINNPLTVINLHNQIIANLADQNKLTREAVYPSIEKIRKTVERVAKIITGLKSFARQDENEPFEKVLVRELVFETLDLCQTRFKNQGVSLEVEVISETLAIECRSVQISQVLLNLLNNSYDAVMNSPVKWVRVEVRESAKECMISIQDSGPGIPKNIRDKITQPFFTTKEFGKGMGLGLSISFGIVSAHRGTLELDSQSHNTCFVIILPKKQPEEKSEVVALSAKMPTV